MWSYIKFIIWGIVWFPIWILMLPFKKKRENCLTWALNKWDTEGGYMVFRWCTSNKFKWLRWPHFLWLPQEHHIYLQHIVPKEEAVNNEKRGLPMPWFNAVQIKGDPDDTKEN